MLLSGLMLFLPWTMALAQEQPDSTSKAEDEYYVTTLSGTRLFEDLENLSSVLLIIPKGEKVRIYEEFGDYYLAEYQGVAGYVRIDNTQFTDETEKKLEEIWARENPQPEPTEASPEQLRMEMMVKRYGEDIGKKIARRAIWKGMSRNMVYDSWGKPRDIRRYTEAGRNIEVWLYRNTSLVFEDGELRDWNRRR